MREAHEAAVKMLGSERGPLDQVRVQKGQMAQGMTPEQIAQRIEQAERRQGFKYSVGQKDVLSRTLTSADRYVAVQGLAGTGKTTMLRSLCGIAQNQGYTVRGMASKWIAEDSGQNGKINPLINAL